VEGGTPPAVAPANLVEFLEAIRAGAIPPPPIATLVGFEIGEVREGEIEFTLVPEVRHYSPNGLVNGGILGVLLDMAIGTAIHSKVPLEGPHYSTVNLSVNYTGRVEESTGRIRARGWVTHVGRRVATGEGRIVRESDGKVLAHGTSAMALAEQE
jgi:uncharacterized protein (TIGR00369 family)